MRLAKPIHDAEGRLVAGTGTLLGERIVRLLRKLAIQTVQVDSAEDVPNWETIRPLAEALADLDARFRLAPAGPELSAIHDAIARHLTRLHAAIEAGEIAKADGGGS